MEEVENIAEKMAAELFKIEIEKVRYFCKLYKTDYHEVHTFVHGVMAGVLHERNDNSYILALENDLKNAEMNLKALDDKITALEQENGLLRNKVRSFDHEQQKQK